MCSQQRQPTTSSQHASASLWLRLIVGLVSVSLLAVGTASAVLYVRFKAKNTQFHEQTLRNQAAVIAGFVKKEAPGPIELPAYVTEAFTANSGRYAVVDRNGQLLAASPGVTLPITAVNTTAPKDFFVLPPSDEQPPFYGFSVKTPYGDESVWVQVAFHPGNIVYDSVLEEFVQDIAWIWIPFVVILLLVNLLVARIGLAPLRTAANQAAAIGPGSASMRLTEAGLPRDVHALVAAVNQGLDRLETAFDAQKRFIADAAHELRTPVTVLKAHVAILPKFEGHDQLVDEIGSLQRLVNQLLDVARLDVLQLGADNVADLTSVATEVASHLGPTAIDNGRSIEVVAPNEPVHICGASDYLFRALRNIVENALRYTPEGTTVSIVVTNPPAIRVIDRGPGVPTNQRHAIFRRFWQGDREANKGGAGLGMDIAARTVVAHGGVMSVEDAPEGGAVFTMQFESLQTSNGSLPARAPTL